MKYNTSLGEIVTHHEELKRESSEEKEKKYRQNEKQNPEKIFLIAYTFHKSGQSRITSICAFSVLSSYVGKTYVRQPSHIPYLPSRTKFYGKPVRAFNRVQLENERP